MKSENVQIKCYIDGCLDIVKCEVKIYDSNNNLFCEGKTNEFGIFNFIPTKGSIYKIVIKPIKNCLYPYKICKIYYSNNITKNIPFIFFKYIPKFHHFITFKLTDENYKNLPIEKGEIKIWNT